MSAMTNNDAHGKWPPDSLLGGLGPAAGEPLLTMGRLAQYPARHTIIHEGDTTTFVVLLLSGMVKVTGHTNTGEALLAVRAAGDIVGELAAYDDRPRLASVTTAGPVIARVVVQRDFALLVKANPDIAFAVARAMSDKLRRATARRVDFNGCDVRTRVARVLWELAGSYGRTTTAGRLVIHCPLTQPELGALAGTSEVSVQRVLREMKADGVAEHRYRETTVLRRDELWRRAFEISE